MTHQRDDVVRGDLPYRLRIGVFGEGTPSDPAALSAVIRGTVDRALPALFDPASRRSMREVETVVACGILTTLAGAAEREIVRTILAMPGARIEVVVPEDPQRYLSRFPAGPDRDDVEGLLAQVRRPTILETGAPAVERGPVPFSAGERRRLAHHVVDHCDLLIAPVSADDPEGAGNPAVRRAAERGRPCVLIPVADSSGVITRPGHGLNAGAIRRLDFYNRIPVEREALERYVENVDSDVFGTATGRRIAPDARATVRRVLLPHYARASLLAKRSQRHYRDAGRAAWFLFPLAAAAAAVAALSPAWRLGAVVVEVVALGAILVVVSHAHHARCHELWVEGRYLAERLRAAVYLAACGIEVTPPRVLAHMGEPEQRDEWMTMAFGEIWSRMPALPAGPEGGLEDVVAFVRQNWLQDQIRFHERKSARCERLSRALERGGNMMFGLALIAAIAHLVVHSMPGARGGGHVLAGVFGFLAIVLPGLGAAMGGFRAHREYSRLAKRSRCMARELRDLDGELAEVETPETLAAALRTAEEFMVQETQDWLMLMRAAPLKQPG